MSVYGSAGSGSPEDPFDQSGATPSSGSGFPPPPANPGADPEPPTRPLNTTPGNPSGADPEPPTLPLHAAQPPQPGQQWGQQPPAGQPVSGQPWQQQPGGGQPVSGQPWQQQPGGGQPVSGQPAAGQPWQQQPAAGQPWGQPAAGASPSGQPWQQQPGQPGQPAGPWTPQYGAEPPKKGNGLKITLIVVGILALLSCLGCAGLFALGMAAEEEADPQPSPSAAASASAEPTPTEAANPLPTSSPSSGANPGDATFAVKGDCLVNDGTSASPKLRKSPCETGSMEVIARVVGSSDKDKCEAYPDTEVYYTYDSPLDARDFVLCMKRR